MRRPVMSVLVFCLAIGVFNSLRAEYRVWTAKTGGFTIEAEFGGLRDPATVILKLKQGGAKDVPLDRLCEADVKYVRAQSENPFADAPTKAATIASDPVVDGNKPPTSGKVGAIEKEAALSATAREAADIYRVFLEDYSVSALDRAIAKARLEYWESLAARKLARLGQKWVSSEEVAAARTKAINLFYQGVELVRLSQDKLAHEKLLEASKTNPNSIEADFLMSLVYALAVRNYTKAEEHLNICLRRDPDNVAVLNNLALVEIKLGQSTEATNHWKAALASSPTQEVGQNIGRLIDQSGKGRINNVPKTIIAKASAMYGELLVAKTIQGVDKRKGWMYMLIPFTPPEDQQPSDQPKADSLQVDPNLNDLPGVIAGTGTGFVVYPQHILTNKHVAEKAAAFEIQDPTTGNQSRHVAKLKALCDNADLALLHCPTLQAQPVTIDAEIPRRGTDIMLLGYPASDVLGTGLKATRGSIVSLPSPQLENMMLYDAVSNGGNSGGPVCSNRGAVVAIHCASYRTATRYAAGIAMNNAVAFIKQTIPEFEQKAVEPVELPWPDVDERVSKSTVLVVVRSKRQDIGLENRIGNGFLEDRTCNLCGGDGKVSCSARGCTRGTVLTTRNTVVGRSVESEQVRVPCNSCGGSGAAPCRACGGSGRDRELQ